MENNTDSIVKKEKKKWNKVGDKWRKFKDNKFTILKEKQVYDKKKRERKKNGWKEK